MHELGSSVGGVPGVVQQGGYTGWVLPSTSDWYCQGPTNARTRCICAHQGTPGPCRPFRTPWLPALRYVAWRPIWARFHHIYTKVSINLRVSPKFLHEACHTPYFKKEVPNVTTLNSWISDIASLLSVGMNGPVLGSRPLLLSKRQSVARCTPRD